jgi:hypothetical protein
MDKLKKINIIVTTLLALLGVSFFLLIIYVSLLGDNDKIDFLVTRFFTEIKARNFTVVASELKTTTRSDLYNDPEKCMKFSFFLELSLLKTFNLLEHKDYSIEIKRDHFWIPWITGDQVWVGVAFREKKKNMFLEFINRLGKDDFIQGLMRIDRKNGHWEIAEIKTDGTTLDPVIKELQSKLDINHYVIKTETGFKLRDNTVDFKTMTPAERRLLEFSLFRLGIQK